MAYRKAGALAKRKLADEEIKAAWELFDKGETVNNIAAPLGMDFNDLSRQLKDYALIHNLEWIRGPKQRSRSYLARQGIDLVKDAYDRLIAGVATCESIAEEWDKKPHTVYDDTLKYAHTHGLPTPSSYVVKNTTSGNLLARSEAKYALIYAEAKRGRPNKDLAEKYGYHHANAISDVLRKYTSVHGLPWPIRRKVKIKKPISREKK